jgi:hypothetical protein
MRSLSTPWPASCGPAPGPMIVTSPTGPGQDSPLSPGMAPPLMAVATQIVEPLRGLAYAPAVQSRAGDEDTARLLSYLGRNPGWTP